MESILEQGSFQHLKSDFFFSIAFSTYWIQIFWELVQQKTIQKENFFLNDDHDMSNEVVEDQDLEELSNKDEIAKKKRPSVLCLDVLCYFTIVIFQVSYYVFFSIKSLFI